MRHKIDFKLLSEYIDRRCSEADKKRIEDHLKECESCRKTALLLKNSDLAMRNLDKAGISSSFDYNFNQRLYKRLKAVEEKRLGYLIENVIKKTKVIIAPPAPVLAGALATLLILAVAYGALKYSLVESPHIVMVRGGVSVYRAKQKTWIEGKEAMKLAHGDVIRVNKNSFTDISHPKKYTIRVKANSEITVSKFLPKYINGTAQYSIEQGKVLVYLAKGFKGSKFVIKTPQASATALGTEFLVDVSSRPVEMTRFGVLEGTVRVKSLFKPEKPFLPQVVYVSGGEATEVYRGEAPKTPRQLLDKEWQEMVEFYQIGKKSQVSLLISNGKYRTRELLRPCPIYIFGLEPPQASEELNKAIYLIDEAIKTKDRVKHLEGIRKLENILKKYPNPDYEPQLLLFIGSYYTYLGMYSEAIKTFDEVASKYPRSTFASMALYATAIIYDEKLRNAKKARNFYDAVLSRYPTSPEGLIIKELEKK